MCGCSVQAQAPVSSPPSRFFFLLLVFFFFLLISAVVFLSNSTVTVIVMGPQTLPEGPPATWGASPGLGVHSGRQRKVPLTSELSPCRERWAVKEALSSHLSQIYGCDFRLRYTAGGRLRVRVGGDGGQPGREVALLALGHRGVMAAGVIFCPPPTICLPWVFRGPSSTLSGWGSLTPGRLGHWYGSERPGPGCPSEGRDLGGLGRALLGGLKGWEGSGLQNPHGCPLPASEQQRVAACLGVQGRL